MRNEGVDEVQTSYLFHGGRVLDPRRDALIDGIEVLTEGDRIKEVADRPISAELATRVDLRGRTLMPGLIDAHVHLLLAEVNPPPPGRSAVNVARRERRGLGQGYADARLHHRT